MASNQIKKVFAPAAFGKNFMNNTLKTIPFSALNCIGASALFRKLNKNKVLIVMYHGVSDSPTSLFCWWQLPFKKFEWQINFLKKNYTILPLREVAEKLDRNEKLPDNVAVITFDDGYRNNYTVAYPLLKKLGIPATIFLATNFIGNKKLLWPDQLYIILRETKKQKLDLTKYGWGVFDLSTLELKREAVDQIGDYFKTVSLDEKYKILGKIKSDLEEEQPLKGLPDFEMLSWEEVETMTKEGLVDFAAHTCSHEILSRLHTPVLRDEIINSCKKVQQGNEQVMFAYTNGRPQDFDRRAKSVLKEINALCAVTTISGLNSSSEDLYELKRISIGDDIDEVNFQLLCSGFIDFFKIQALKPNASFHETTLPQEKITVVLLTDCLVHLAGGAEKQIFELVKGLDKSKYNVFVASLESYGQAPRDLIEAVGGHLEVFRVVRIYGLTGLIQGIKFFRFLKKNKVDILQTYHFSSDIWGAFWGRLARVPIIMSNRRDMGFWRSFFHIWTYRLVNKWVKKVIVNASPMRDHFIRTEGLPFDKFEVIYNGVELPEIHKLPSNEEIRSKFKISKDDIVFMHVANFKPVKGHTYLLKAFKEVLSHHPNTRLFLIGEDTTNGAIHALANELGITNQVVFIGKHPDVKSLLPAADICLLPSLSEGMSNSILEYMATAKPVIATNVGGNPELIDDGVHGILVEKENIPQLRDAMLKLITDPALRNTMGNNGLEKVRRYFSMNAMIANYERLYSSFSVFVCCSLNESLFSVAIL